VSAASMGTPDGMDRSAAITALEARSDPWDLLIIGGGATGLAAALDAASRGHSVALVERDDFAHGTSSRSTKLVHGGVRYLQQGNVALVMEALRERGILRKMAPHLVHDLPFVVPSYRWWESPFYGIGMKVYDMLAFRYGFGGSRMLDAAEVRTRIPNISEEGLRGGTLYHDGQFDDARLAIAFARTAVQHGAVLANYAEVTAVTRASGSTRQLSGAIVLDRESGRELTIRAKVVVNATGPFTDSVRRLVDPAAEPMIAPSQGVHIVLDRKFLAGDDAIMVPHTTDGRVMFAIPWHHVVVVGTTDTPVDEVPREPKPLPEEIDFILDTANRYLAHDATRADIRSTFAGIRPLVQSTGARSTAAISRDHTIHIDPDSGLVTIAGGKWTTCRKMAQDLIDHVETLGDLSPARCVTANLHLHGYRPSTPLAAGGVGGSRAVNRTSLDADGPLASYGSDIECLRSLVHLDPQLREPLHERLPTIRAQVVHAVRHEMARRVEDVLSRRTRCLLFDAAAAVEAASSVATMMASELRRDAAWEADEVAAFTALAADYIVA